MSITNSLDNFPAEYIERFVFFTNDPKTTGLISKTFLSLTEDECGKTNFVMLTILKTTGLYALLPLDNDVHVLAEVVNKQGNYKSIKLYYQISRAIHALALKAGIYSEKNPKLVHSDLEMYEKLNRIMISKLRLNHDFKKWELKTLLADNFWLNYDGTLIKSISEFFLQYKPKLINGLKKFSFDNAGACLPSEFQFLDINRFHMITDGCISLAGDNLNKLTQLRVLELETSVIEMGQNPGVNYARRVKEFRDQQGISLQVLPNNLTLKNLTHIFIVGNEIKSFPSCFNVNLNLKHINLSHNLIEEIDLMAFKKLETIRIECNKLKKFPQIDSSTLTELMLDENEIPEIPSDINKFTHLNHIHIGHNKLTSLPNSICQMTQLSCLSVSHNKIEELPENWNHLRNTQRDTHGNPLKNTTGSQPSIPQNILATLFGILMAGAPHMQTNTGSQNPTNQNQTNNPDDSEFNEDA